MARRDDERAPAACACVAPNNRPSQTTGRRPDLDSPNPYDRKSWFGWFGTQMGAEWKEMDKDDKEPFEALAEKDKARYEREMANYTPPPQEDSDSDDE